MTPEERDNAKEIARLHADAHMDSIKAANRKIWNVMKWTMIILVLLVGSCVVVMSA